MSDAHGHRRRSPSRAHVRNVGNYTVEPGETIARLGITRQPRSRTAPDAPPNERALQVLAALAPGELARPAQLARSLGLSSKSVTSTLYALGDRGLVERIPSRGWRRLGS